MKAAGQFAAQGRTSDSKGSRI